MESSRFAALLLVLLMAACGGVKQTAPAEPPKGEPEAKAVAPIAPSAQANAPSAPTTPPAVAATPPSTPPAESPAASPPAQSEKVAKATPPTTKAPAKTPPPPPAEKKEVAPPQATKPLEPPLDLASLEKRLKDTNAIGVLTKLSLKNQVDDLLNQFRGFYAGKLKTTLAELRRPYDLLILKVLSLLQDKDPPLASDLAASREAIWAILADPVKFAKALAA